MSSTSETPLVPIPSEVISVLNAASPTEVECIVKRVISNFQNTTHCSFNDDELSHLLNVPLTNKNVTNHLTVAVQFITQQAAFHLIKPDILSDYLKKFGLNDQTNLVISDTWGYHAKQVVETFRKESLLPEKIGSVETSIHYPVSSHSKEQSKVPVGLLHLKIVPKAAHATALTLEFTQPEMSSFFELLETIQAQVDEIV